MLPSTTAGRASPRGRGRVAADSQRRARARCGLRGLVGRPAGLGVGEQFGGVFAGGGGVRAGEHPRQLRQPVGTGRPPARRSPRSRLPTARPRRSRPPCRRRCAGRRTRRPAPGASPPPPAGRGRAGPAVGRPPPRHARRRRRRPRRRPAWGRAPVGRPHRRRRSDAAGRVRQAHLDGQHDPRQLTAGRAPAERQRGTAGVRLQQEGDVVGAVRPGGDVGAVDPQHRRARRRRARQRPRRRTGCRHREPVQLGRHRVGEPLRAAARRAADTAARLVGRQRRPRRAAAVRSTSIASSDTSMSASRRARRVGPPQHAGDAGLRFVAVGAHERGQHRPAGLDLLQPLRVGVERVGVGAEVGAQIGGEDAEFAEPGGQRVEVGVGAALLAGRPRGRGDERAARPRRTRSGRRRRRPARRARPGRRPSARRRAPSREASAGQLVVLARLRRGGLDLGDAAGQHGRLAPQFGGAAEPVGEGVGGGSPGRERRPVGGRGRCRRRRRAPRAGRPDGRAAAGRTGRARRAGDSPSSASTATGAAAPPTCARERPDAATTRRSTQFGLLAGAARGGSSSSPPASRTRPATAESAPAREPARRRSPGPRPSRTRLGSARPPKSSSSPVTTIVLPAPVSPVTTVRPGPNSGPRRR